MKKNRLFLILLFIAKIGIGQTELIKVTDLTKVKNVTDLVTSKDGKKAIYTLKTTEETPDKPFEYEYVNNLFLIDLAAAEQPIALTAGKLGASQACFAPDGSQISFVRTVA